VELYLAVNAGVDDEMTYKDAKVGDIIKIKTNVSGNSTFASTTDAANCILVEQSGTDNGTDTLISIERIIGTKGVDTFEIETLSAAQLAGTDNQGGLAEIDFGENDKPDKDGDLIDASKSSQNLVINMADDGYVQVKDDAETKVKIKGAQRAFGGSGDDEITGSGSDNTLIGGAGKDKIKGGGGNDVIYTSKTASEDDGSADEVEGGAGADKIYVGNGDKVLNPDGGDKIYLNSKLLTGGEREAAPKDPCNPQSEQNDNLDGTYDGSDGTKYELSGTTLKVTLKSGETITITAFSNCDGGINLKDKRPDVDQAECQRDPLIIDLDGDRNVVTELFDSWAYFDLNNDGFQEHVAWAMPSDGLLVRDLNGNGRIDDGSELFGSGRVETQFGRPAPAGTEGFAELSTLDSDGDKMISALDTAFSTLLVWVDANGDAVTDEGELKTLAELGLVSISLITRASDNLDCGCDGTSVASMSIVVRETANDNEAIKMSAFEL
jgi:Ca2+-binding RTX toxin-like protein